MTDGERWKPIPGHDGYEVSDHGRVRSLDREVPCKDRTIKHLKGRALRPWPVARGHLVVGLGYRARHLVHHLVLEAFVGPRADGMCGLHEDDNRVNNHLSNLRWGTTSENMHDRVRNGIHLQASRTHCKRGHRLVDPNLAEWMKRRGHRNCLACSRSHAQVYSAKLKGVLLDWQAISDAYYEEIMSGRAAPQGPRGGSRRRRAA